MRDRPTAQAWVGSREADPAINTAEAQPLQRLQRSQPSSPAETPRAPPPDPARLTPRQELLAAAEAEGPGEGHELARIRGMPLRHEAETAGGEARLIRRDSDAEASPKASPNASPNANDAAKGGRGRDGKGLGGRVSSTAGAGAAGMRGNYSAAGQAGKSFGAGTPTPRQRARSLSSDAKGIVTCGVFPSSAAPSCACLCVFFGPHMFCKHSYASKCITSEVVSLFSFFPTPQPQPQRLQQVRACSNFLPLPLGHDPFSPQSLLEPCWRILLSLPLSLSLLPASQSDAHQCAVRAARHMPAL